MNIGNPGSGQRGTTEVLMSGYGMTSDDLAVATGADPDRAVAGPVRRQD